MIVGELGDCRGGWRLSMSVVAVFEVCDCQAWWLSVVEMVIVEENFWDVDVDVGGASSARRR